MNLRQFYLTDAFDILNCIKYLCLLFRDSDILAIVSWLILEQPYQVYCIMQKGKDNKHKICGQKLSFKVSYGNKFKAHLLLDELKFLFTFSL